MPRLREALALFWTMGVALGPIPTGFVWASRQASTKCMAGKIVRDACASEAWVAVRQNQPFLAERVLTVTTASIPTQEYPELVARDSAGRIREEQDLHFMFPGNGRPFFPILALGGVPSSQNDLNINGALEKAASADKKSKRIITILDCFRGTRSQFSSNELNAQVQTACSDQPAFQASGQPYSKKLTRFLETNNRPDVTAEDLGHKKINGILARGIRITWLGSEKDGAWKGKPARIWEEWMSDKLGVTLLQVYSDETKGIKNRRELRNMRAQEPDASLFQISADYKITYVK